MDANMLPISIVCQQGGGMGWAEYPAHRKQKFGGPSLILIDESPQVHWDIDEELPRPPSFPHQCPTSIRVR